MSISDHVEPSLLHLVYEHLTDRKFKAIAWRPQGELDPESDTIAWITVFVDHRRYYYISDERNTIKVTVYSDMNVIQPQVVLDIQDPQMFNKLDNFLRGDHQTI